MHAVVRNQLQIMQDVFGGIILVALTRSIPKHLVLRDMTEGGITVKQYFNRSNEWSRSHSLSYPMFTLFSQHPSVKNYPVVYLHEDISDLTELRDWLKETPFPNEFVMDSKGQLHNLYDLVDNESCNA